MKKILVVLFSFVFFITLVACDKNTNTGRQEDDGVLTVLYETASNPGVGPADQVLKDTEKKLAIEENNILRTTMEHTSVLNSAVKGLGYKLVYEDYGWAESLQQKQTLSFLANSGPDVMIGETQMPGFAQQGLLLPFPEDLEAWVRENIVPGAYTPMEIDGKIYGVAAQPSISLLVYNKEIVNDVFGSNWEAPLTWQEWYEDMTKIKDAGYIPGGFYAGANAGGYLRFGILQLQAGGGFVNENNEPNFDNEGNKTALQFLRDVATLNKEAAGIAGLNTASSEGAFSNKFTNGQVAFVIDGSWNPQTCSNYPELSDYGCGVAPLPKPTLDSEDKNITIGASFLSVPNYIAESEEEVAFAYIKAALSIEAQKPIVNSAIRIPVNKALVTDEFLASKPILSTYFDEMLNSDVYGLPTFDYENAKCWQQVGYSYVKAATTDLTIDNILAETQSKLKEYYERNQ